MFGFNVVFTIVHPSTINTVVPQYLWEIGSKILTHTEIVHADVF